MGLSKRKPIYLPFPQAVPPVPVIDPDTCIQFKSGKCKKTCLQACGERKAINFQQQEKFEEIEIGSVILATGFKPFDAARTPYYGYGTYPNVYTSLEVERLVNASGPTSGEVVLRDGSKPKAIGIIHCVGSRDEGTNRWCSRVCCMYSLKLAHLLKEHTGRRGLQLLHRHAHAGQGLRGVLPEAAQRRRAFHPRPRGRGDRLGARLHRREPAGAARRGHAARRGAPDSGRHGGAFGGHRAARRRGRGAPDVQHVLRQPRDSSWSGTRSWPR